MKLSDSKIDGTLYVSIAVFTFLQGVFGSDEAVKLMPVMLLFISKVTVGAIAAGSLALKMFRSTQFAEGKALNGNGNGNGTQVTTTIKTPPPSVDVTVKGVQSPTVDVGVGVK